MKELIGETAKKPMATQADLQRSTAQVGELVDGKTISLPFMQEWQGEGPFYEEYIQQYSTRDLTNIEIFCRGKTFSLMQAKVSPIYLQL